MSIEKPCNECSGEGANSETRKSKSKSTLPESVMVTDCAQGVGGDAGSRGGPSGDLAVDAHIDDHSLFERDDDDLFHEVQIPLALSAWVEPFRCQLWKVKFPLKIPAGTQSNKTFRLIKSRNA